MNTPSQSDNLKNIPISYICQSCKNIEFYAQEVVSLKNIGCPQCKNFILQKLPTEVTSYGCVL